MKEKAALGKRLASYSALTTAFLVSTKAADAQIIYTDINPDDTTFVTDTYLLDLNNDGITDFKFNLNPLSNYSGKQIRVVGYGSNSISRDTIEHAGTYQNYAYANALSSGAVIGGLAAFYNKEILGTYYSFYTYGNWAGTTDYFLGLKLVANANSYYGWVRLSVSPTCSQLIASEYAVDTIADEAIQAGDKCGNYSSFVNTVINPSDSVSLCEGNNAMLSTDSISGFTYQWVVNGNTIAGATNFTYSTDSTGSFNVIVTNSYGCADTSQQTHVILFPLPDAPVISQSLDTLFSTFASSYQWYLNAVPILGASDQTFVAVQGGEYTVQVTDANGCSSLSNSYAFIPDGVSNPDDVIISVLERNNIVTVKLIDEKFLGAQMKIFNARRDVVHTSVVNSEIFQVDLNQWPAGIYFLTIVKNDKDVVRKIVIQ